MKDNGTSENLTPICPSTGEYCELKEYCIVAIDEWNETAADIERTLSHQQKISSSFLGLIFRRSGSDLKTSSRQDFQAAKERAVAFEEVMQLPCAAKTVDDCPIPERLVRRIN